ncbi:hypothetical protein DFH05DRAFT_1071314 [Lentinula detonsa]|uniref:Translation initiation factor eIF2B subunit alpha n=1 Tax=Lentinula detonsa TaxID=2804962 RepID=A0A9W8TXQ0_9AGAR|nr:hypothetical protein DFH05DRAFT_1071314 [Lentinula detonsa]
MDDFQIYKSYQRLLKNEDLSTPLAAILALTEMMEQSNAGTMFELLTELKGAAEALSRQSLNPIGLKAGCELFIEFITLFPHDAASFSELKTELIRQGQRYAEQALAYRAKIAELAFDFIKDDSVILTHSYSRVVLQTLLLAHKRKRISGEISGSNSTCECFSSHVLCFSVFVTEARPRGMGIKTAEMLTAAGIPCTVVLDSAVAYAIDKVDFVLMGSEAVVESGGLVNAVGSNQIAIIAKAANKPFYALAESYKFHRMFPLSQYDLPSHNPGVLSFPQTMSARARPASSGLPSKASSVLFDNGSPIRITQEDIARNNPDVDYTRPDLISLVFSDVGSLTPEGVSQYLVGMFAG